MIYMTVGKPKICGGKPEDKAIATPLATCMGLEYRELNFRRGLEAVKTLLLHHQTWLQTARKMRCDWVPKHAISHEASAFGPGSEPDFADLADPLPGTGNLRAVSRGQPSE